MNAIGFRQKIAVAALSECVTQGSFGLFKVIYLGTGHKCEPNHVTHFKRDYHSRGIICLLQTVIIWIHDYTLGEDHFFLSHLALLPQALAAYNFPCNISFVGIKTGLATLPESLTVFLPLF